MTACLLLFYRTISTFFVVFCLNAILIRTVLGLGAMTCVDNQLRDSRNFFEQRQCLKICIDIMFSCVLSTVFQRWNWSEVKWHNDIPRSIYIEGCEPVTSVVRYLKLERRLRYRLRYRDTRYYRDTGNAQCNFNVVQNSPVSVLSLLTDCSSQYENQSVD